MNTLIINTSFNISATAAYEAIAAEGNVHTEVKGHSFVVHGAHIHLVRIYNRVTGRKQQFLSSPTIVLNK